MVEHAADTYDTGADGLKFQLSTANGAGAPVRAGQVNALKINVSDAATGKPVKTLEPVMNAFAHLVGFYDDHRTVVHVHPLGSDVTDPATRGGPELEFKFYPPKPGFIRLYCQVQIGGRAVYGSFDVNVGP